MRRHVEMGIGLCVEQVMNDRSEFSIGGCNPNIQPSIDLTRVRADDLGPEESEQRPRQETFSRLQ